MTWLKYQEVLPIMPPYIRCFIDDLCSYAGSNHVLSWNTFLVVKTCLCNRNVCVQFSCIDCRFSTNNKQTTNFLWTNDLLVMALMLSQSISSPKTYQNVLQGYGYDRDIYEFEVNVWTWKFSRTGCRESRFLPDDWPQCDSSDLLFSFLSHN